MTKDVRDGSRKIRSIVSIALLCVLAAAGPALAVEPGTGKSTEGQARADDLGGRWHGRSYELARSDACGGEPCTLTLDLVRCASGWCGVEVLAGTQTCGATALKLDGGALNPNGPTVFKGSLALAKGTEPYVVEAYLIGPTSPGDKTEMQLAGDTGGEFRAFRRSFPYNATLARIGEATCKPESTVSLLAD